MNHRTEPILAIDPGLRDLGMAVLSGRRLAAAGALTLRRLPRSARLKEVRRHVKGWLRLHHPHAIVMEKTYHHPLPWLDDVHRLTLTVRRLARLQGIPFATYSPQQVRQGVLGNGRATKAEAAVAVAVRFPQLRVYLTQDRKWKERFWQNMFDAVALAMHHQTATQPPSRGR
ncbi:MAG: crossover junction endodeoxyribonuclease RuvC [Candidatus Kerfeldbacteria bacterium]